MRWLCFESRMKIVRFANRTKCATTLRASASTMNAGRPPRIWRATPRLDAMLSKFNIEHRHDEDEVRYIIAGRGLFHIHAQQGPVVAIEVEAGDLIRVPRGTLHWFDLCGDRRIRAIRLFQDKSGWTPHYSGSGMDRNYEPVCWGPRYIPTQTAAK